MTFGFTLNDLIHHLKEQGHSPELHKESQNVFITLPIKNFAIPLFFLLRTESPLLQMVAYLPYKIPEKSLNEIARLLHVLNKDFDMPGFCLDEAEQLIFYRAALPCLEGHVDQRLFTVFIKTVRIACDTFMNAIGLALAKS